MRKQATLFLILFLGAFYLMKICLAAASPLNRSLTDERSLLAIKDHITSDPNNILANNWSIGTSFCTWIGVTCSWRRPRVAAIDFFNMSLQGTIAKEIGNLSFLTYLNIGNNSFNGVIPDEIGTLRRLRVLLMSFNWLSGEIPLTFGFLTNLEYLNIRGNRLNGALPWSIFNISSLHVVDLTLNHLSGSLPLDMCYHLPKLNALYLSFNKLSGGIPKTLSACSQLNELNLSHNNFTGRLPVPTGNLSRLQLLSLGTNSFTGTILPTIGNLSNLRLLDLSNNNFGGNIPLEIESLSSLTHLNLQLNKLNGETPQSVFNLSRLKLLSLTFNELSGKLPFSMNRGLPNLEKLYLGQNHFIGRIPNSISNLTNLKLLALANNSFSGPIPITLGDLHNLETFYLQGNFLENDLSIPKQDFLTPLQKCRYLEKIGFSFNNITGLLPKSIGNMSASLKIFDASANWISGTIPGEIGNLSRLIWLNLRVNELTGMIPPTLGQLKNLQRLDLDYNKLSGSIPNNFCKLEKIYYVNVMDNRISGPLPRCIGNLVFLQELILSNNIFDGSLSDEIGNLKRLVALDLSENQLSGKIPSILGQIESLYVLSLSNNKLHGRIPESFHNLKGLEYLDLSQNNLSGEIPKSLETLIDLTYFNVSFNELSGEIPDGGPFINLTADFFKGNKELCGPSRFEVEACKKNMFKTSNKNIFLRYIFPPIASIVFAATIVILFLKCRARKSLSSPLSNLPLGFGHERVTYYELLRATNNLDEMNLIGKGSLGSVYKGIFSNGMSAAIKVFDLDVQGALKSFDIECQILSSIRHRNLVKVITCCSNLDFKALVLEYMPNGNLDNWLYSPPDHSLSFAQRLGIMMDVASAIEYLHQGYPLPIVHCDLKPNNILLDEDMVAHVGDFGISKLLTQDQRIAHTKTLGTIGYMAPEYGSGGLISTSVDVYSYGILLMEIFTRKKPTNVMFMGELTLKSWVFGSLPNDVMKIVDVDLLNVDEENTRSKLEVFLTSILEVALECTVDSLEERLNIKHIILKLKEIENEL